MDETTPGRPPARRRWRLLATLTTAALLATVTVTAPAASAKGWARHDPGPAADVPNPTVEGPIPVTEESHPLFATDLDLAEAGYVEEEYFISGDARWYDIPAFTETGELAGTADYLTRIVVRRPVSPKTFNGTVIMEWNNVSAGFDLEALWFESAEHVLREGYAWMAVSAQRVGANFLRDWDEERYARISVDAEGVPADALSYDIFSQAAQSVKSPEGIDPMPRLKVRRILATGASQSGFRLGAYYNSVQPLHNLIDGFIPATADIPLRDDLEVPALKLLAEGDVRAESDEVDHAYYRRWEAAGTSHVTYKAGNMFRPLSERDLGGYSVTECDLPTRPRIPFHHAANAAFDAMDRWVHKGRPAPIAPRLEWEDGAIARDGDGNALGGIRLPQFEVATATATGINTGPGSCRLQGSWEPFSDEELAERYRTRGRYIAQVNKATTRAQLQGFLTRADARETRRQATRDALVFGREDVAP